MRNSIFALLVVVSGCIGGVRATAGDEPPGEPAGGGGPPARCSFDDDCVAAAKTCCECPTFAVNRQDPIHTLCLDVDCMPEGEPTCSEAVAAVCNAGACELACQPMACATSCEYGYARDASGCLSCACAVPPPDGCRFDTECVQTRADCCGCRLGGIDTAVLGRDQAAYDSMLMCAPEPACPGLDVCTTDVPLCVQGSCALIPRELPRGACGRFDLPACSAGLACTVNLSDPANLHGVGICAPP